MSTFNVQFYEYGQKSIYPTTFLTYEEARDYIKYFVEDELGVNYIWSGKKGTLCHITDGFNIKIIENKGQ
jgi:hypothetical protein